MRSKRCTRRNFKNVKQISALPTDLITETRKFLNDKVIYSPHTEVINGEVQTNYELNCWLLLQSRLEGRSEWFRLHRKHQPYVELLIKQILGYETYDKEDRLALCLRMKLISRDKYVELST